VARVMSVMCLTFIYIDFEGVTLTKGVYLMTNFDICNYCPRQVIEVIIYTHIIEPVYSF
jgi:hypothetical protein